MRFKITNTVAKDRFDLTPIINLYVWEIIEYGVDAMEDWVKFHINFATTASARAYAVQYAQRSSEEEFIV